MSDGLVDLTTKVRTLYRAGKIEYRRPHIERERAYREVLVAELGPVLENGKATSVNNQTNTVKWQGRDRDQRLLELLITLYDVEGEETLVVEEAEEGIVGTAYEPGKRDDEVRKRWLEDNPDWEEYGGSKVRKKVVVEKRIVSKESK